MPLIPSILNWLNVKRLHQINLFKEYPNEVQKEELLGLIDEAKDTWWGKKYGFASISNHEQFKSRLPIQTYDNIQDIIGKLRKGEKDLVWPRDIKWFAKSSGTTSAKSKFIPVSQESLERCHLRGPKDALAIYTSNNPETGVFAGKGLTLGGSHSINNYSNQSYYGDLSAIMIENLPFWAEFIRTPKAKIALMDEWDKKLSEIARTTIQDDVTSIAGVPSWNLVLIKYILEKTGKNNLLEIWPNLELFIHGGVNFEPYRSQFEKLIPTSRMNYMETYNASEGFFGIQDDPNEKDMLLMLDYGVFYEFIPMDKIHEESPPTLSIGEVETGVNYAILISTNSGLWRYKIGDTIIFSKLYPHKFRISGRTKHFLNAFGEEIIIDNAEKALGIACKKTGAQINEYTAAPVYMGDKQQGTHEWLFEFNKEPSDLEYFTDVLDHALMSVNSDYEAKRFKDITLIRPYIRKVKKGVFYNWFNNKGKLGGQNKMPRLSNDRKYVEELLKINNSLT
ncbi:MAG: GH3 auxin-responsive promoter family protein [Bacteroidales bacterium]|nr:GH3 auxin-responsive promoter family protein [Bacteroidales bacterium]